MDFHQLNIDHAGHTRSGILPNTPSFINYVYAAQAAFAQSDAIRGEEYLVLAKKSEPHASDVVDMIQAQSDLKHHRFGEAVASLKRLSAKNKYVLLALKTAYEQLGDWPALFMLLPELSKLMSDDEFNAFSKKVYTHFLHDASDVNLDGIKQAWNKLPRKTRKDPALIAIYAKALIHFHDDLIAESLLRQTLKKKWNTSLIKLYGTLQCEKPEKMLHTAEKFLQDHPHSPELLLALGRLSTTCKLWGQAKDYLLKSHKLAASKDSSLALATLYEKLGHTTESLLYYKKSIT